MVAGPGLVAGDSERPAAETPAAGPPPSAEKRVRISTFRSLRHVDFRYLWLSTILASSGQWIQQITVGWLAYQMTGSPVWVGAVNGVRSIPLLFLGPFGGVAADRINRKRLMFVSNAILVVLTGTFAWLLLTGQAGIVHLIAFTLLTGVVWAFNMPVRQSIVPSLVPRDDLLNALALNSAGNNVTRILGPSIGGILIAQLGAGDNFLLQSFIYSGVLWMVFRLNIPPVLGAKQESVLANLREGARFTWRHATLRTQMALALVPMIIAFPYTALMPIFAAETLDVGSSGYGLLMAAPGVGALIGTLTVATLGTIERKGFVILASVFLQGVFLVLVSQTRYLPVSMICLVLFGAVQMVYMTMNQTVVQLTAPPELRGRVMGIYMLNQGMLPFGSLLAGLIASQIGVPNTILLLGISTCLFALGFIFRAGNLRSL